MFDILMSGTTDRTTRSTTEDYGNFYEERMRFCPNCPMRLHSVQCIAVFIHATGQCCIFFFVANCHYLCLGPTYMYVLVKA